MAGMWWKVPGGLLGLMAGGAVAPEEAEAAIIPHFRSKFFRDVKYGIDTGRRKNSKVGTLHPEAWEAMQAKFPEITTNDMRFGTHGALNHMPDFRDESIYDYTNQVAMLGMSPNIRPMPNFPSRNPNLGRKSIGMVVNPDTYFVAPFMKGPDGGIICTTGYLADKTQKRFIDSYLKSIYPESLGRAWTLGGPSVPPSLVRRSGSPDLLVRSDGEFSAVEGMPLESNLSKASQKSNTTETKKTSGTAMGVGLGLPAKIPDDAYGADSNVYSRSLHQIGIGARSLLSGALDGLSLGLAKPGTTLSDYLGLPKPEKGTPEELVSGLIRGAADGAGYLLPGAGLAKAAAAYPKAKMLGEYLASAPYLQTGLGGLVGLLDVMGKSGGD